MTNQNELAEDLMRRVEREEDMQPSRMSPSPAPASGKKQYLHLCIINLVIGTLYCAKGNYEFGISRIMKSFDPVSQKVMSKSNRLQAHSILAKHGYMVLRKAMSFGAFRNID
jgi:tetratricopeptide repeat protein 30